MNKLELQKMANEIRKGIIDGVHAAKAGHPGGSLSATEVFTYLYFEEMNIDPKDPKNPNRDRFVLSKGHTAPGLYSTLAHRGYFPVEDLLTLRQIGSHLQGHPCIAHTPGIDMSSGSLGQGISAAVGMALGAKHQKKDFRVYTLLGDGEIQEGVVWEAAENANKYKADHLITIVDWNGVQLDGTNDEIMPLGDLQGKWKAFGYNVIECDGHDVASISDTIAAAKQVKGQPTVILAHTVKGKGVSFMEGKSAWHGKAIDDASYEQAMKELGGAQ